MENIRVGKIVQKIVQVKQIKRDGNVQMNKNANMKLVEHLKVKRNVKNIVE